MTDTFPWVSLDPDEEVAWSGRPRPHVIGWLAVPALAIPILLVLVGRSVLSAVVGVLAWAAISYLGYVYVKNIDYVVSTNYVYSKSGILGRSVTQIGLHNIQDTTLSQGIIGTYSNYGTVAFSTAGGDGTTLSYYLIDEPSTVKSTIDQQITNARRGTKDRAGPSTERNLEDLLSELRATRKAAQRIDHLFEEGGNQQ